MLTEPVLIAERKAAMSRNMVTLGLEARETLS